VNLGEPAIAAGIGLLGIFLGSLIQAHVARTNRRHERRLALEVKRAEERFRAYAELSRYVMDAEMASGRSPGAFHALIASEGAASDGAEKQPDLTADLAARLSTFGSMWVGVIFAFWRSAHAGHVSLQVTHKLFRELESAEDAPKLSGDDWKNLERLIELSNKQSGDSADRVLRQIRAELEGEATWRNKHRRLRNWVHERRNMKRQEREELFIEEGMDYFRAIIFDLAESVRSADEFEGQRLDS
jgi:hypothetical protein